MWWRINSPFLPDADESDDLIEQYQDITDVCNVTLPPALIRALPSYPTAPSPTYLPPGTDPNENMTVSDSAPCGGQTISASTKKRSHPSFENFHHSSGHSRVKRASAGTCDFLSQTYGVTTGDLQMITGTDDCSFDDPSICVPSKCDVVQVGDSQSW